MGVGSPILYGTSLFWKTFWIGCETEKATKIQADPRAMRGRDLDGLSVRQCKSGFAVGQAIFAPCPDMGQPENGAERGSHKADLGLLQAVDLHIHLFAVIGILGRVFNGEAFPI
jgi:hypothetical protein